MATAYELLAGMEEVDKTLVIDNYLRVINIPSTVKTLGVEYDDEVLKLDFRMPRYVSDTDLSKFSISINYINSNGESDVYTVSNPAIYDQFITFSWLVGPTATRYKGNTKFNVCLKTADAEGVIQKEFNTTVATLPVLEGLEVDERVVTNYTDIIEQWRQELFGIGDTEEANIRSVSQQEQAAIENKGAEVLATIPADYMTAVSMTDNADRTKADAIICSAHGATIVVADSSDDYLRGLKIFGRTTQVSTTGKQLININQTTKSSNGITFTPNQDGSVHVKGTATANAYFIFDSNNPVPVRETELIASISGSDRVYMVVGYFTSDGTVVNSIASVDDKTTQTFTYPTAAVTTRTFLGVDTGKTVDATVYPMVRLATVTDESYEPYSGGLPSPSPEFPRELVNVENPTISVYGKNLLKFNHADNYLPTAVTLIEELENGVILQGADGAVPGGSTYSSGWYQVCYNKRIPLKAGTYVTFSADYTVLENPHETTANISMHFGAKDSYALNDFVRRPPDGIKTRISRTVLIEKDEDYFFTVGLNSCKVQIENIQLEISTTPTAFEPYIEKQTFIINRILPAIRVSENGNYTDVNGQQWISDEIDFERGVYIQRVYRYVVTGSETFFASPATDIVEAGNIRAEINNLQLPSPFPTDAGNSGLCTHYKYQVTNKTPVSCWAVAHSAGNGRLRFVDSMERFPTVDDFILFAKAEYDRGNPITMQYLIKTPIEIPLTTEEIEWFKFAHTNFPNTTILNNHGTMMSLRYNADTKTWLENLPKATDEQVRSSINAWLEAHYTKAEGVRF